VLVLAPWPLKYIVNVVISGKHEPHWLSGLATDRWAILYWLGGAMLAFAAVES
jgi:hypothetical protein